MTQGQTRIIGGTWRGRKLPIPDVPDLRPTPNRVRETLFNWLQSMMAGAHCLDLFAGSGALGFEALSRGAAQVTMVDQSSVVIKLLREIAAKLGTTQAEIYQAKVPAQLKLPLKPFDVVFLDPPFKQDMLLACCAYLENAAFLADQAYIYLEAPKILPQDALPSNWQLLKCKQAGQVAYHLALRKKLILENLSND